MEKQSCDFEPYSASHSEDALMNLLFLVQEIIVAKWNKFVHN